MTRTRAICLLPLLMTVGCQFTQDLGGPGQAALIGAGDGGGGAGGGAGSVTVLVDHLDYPRGLWVRDGKVYFTEAASTDTSYGGISRLSSYDLATNVRTTLVENPTNHDAVVVASDGNIYLGGWSDTIPGGPGHVSVVYAGTIIEWPVVDLEAGVGDMFIDDADDIYVAAVGVVKGPIYRLAAGDYAHPTVFRALETSAMTSSGLEFYVSKLGHQTRISRFSVLGSVDHDWMPEDPTWLMTTSLTAHDDYLFYGGYGAAETYAPNSSHAGPGEIRRVDLTTGEHRTTVAGGLAEVNNVRVDPATGLLYVLDAGTTEGEYHDGRLLVVDPGG
ncbi:MAG TPA: hypothetical protein VHB21_22835 [Minicystis sp.]|nr:hypothetical protein [Minicystis sp.]